MPTGETLPVATAELLYDRITSTDAAGRASEAYEFYHVYNLGNFSDGNRPDKFLVNGAQGFPLKYEAHATIPGIVAVRRWIHRLIDTSSLYAVVHYQRYGSITTTRSIADVDSIDLDIPVIDDGIPPGGSGLPKWSLNYVLIRGGRSRITRTEKRLVFGGSDLVNDVQAAVAQNLRRIYNVPGAAIVFGSVGSAIFGIPFVLSAGGADPDGNGHVEVTYKFQTLSRVSGHAVGDLQFGNDILIPELNYLEDWAYPKQDAPGAVPYIPVVLSTGVSSELGGPLPGM